MENSDDPREIKQLSYDVLKSLLKYSTIDKREEMVRNIPDLRTIEKKIPFQFDEVNVYTTKFRFIIGNLTRSWYIAPALQQIAPCTIILMTEYYHKSTIYYKTSCGARTTSTKLTLNMNYKEAIKKLLQYYLRRGSKTKVLRLSEEPMRPENVFLKAEHLMMGNVTLQGLNEWRSIVEDIPNKEAVIKAFSYAASFLNDPLVRTFQKMTIMFPTVRNEEVDLAVLNCQNKHIVVDDNFPIEKMIELIKRWIMFHRPLGSTFTVIIWNAEFITQIIDHALAHFKAIRSKFPDRELEHCVAVPMDIKQELVIFAEPPPTPRFGNGCTFKVEVLQAGITVPID